ncbi:hypothetical protein, partial [Corynebacterium argentoratense]|uniref:hypothetical protein n=1 Tax=Corynebacterium argentoratense TaxID=42817 RepID=UPI00248E4F75
MSPAHHVAHRVAGAEPTRGETTKARAGLGYLVESSQAYKDSNRVDNGNRCAVRALCGVHGAVLRGGALAET